MKKNLFFATVTISLLLSASAQALKAPAIDISASEKAQHIANIKTIISASSDCLKATYADHLDFHNKWGFSKYFGNRSKNYDTAEERLAAIRALKKNKLSDAQIQSLAQQLKGTACITLTLQCLEKGFQAAGQDQLFKKIDQALKPNDYLGTELQSILQMLGWRIYYWNPDPSQNAIWDAEDRRLNPLKDGKKWMSVWGGHSAHYNSVQKGSSYYGIEVDNKSALVGFKNQAPTFIKSVPFFIGTAHVGYHVFPGFYGQVIEAHSTRHISARDNLETAEFNPLNGGGPKWTKTEKYRSGIIAIPPGF